MALSFVGLQFVIPAAEAAVTTPNLVLEINNARTAAGLPTLVFHDALGRAADAKLKNILDEQYFGHTAPSGATPWDWFRQSGYAYTAAGENLAMDFADAKTLVAAWLESAQHRENILDPVFREIGLSVRSGTLNGSAHVIIAAMFGSRTSADAAALPSPIQTTKPQSAQAPAKPAADSEPITQPPVPTVETIHSLVEPIGVPIPELSFTFKSPDTYIGTPRAPAVLGVVSAGPAGIAADVANQVSVFTFAALGLSLISVAAFGAYQAVSPRPQLAG